MTPAQPLDWLLPRPVEPVRLVPADSRNAAHAVRDRLLRPLGTDLLVARDVPIGPLDRASALRAEVPAGAVVARRAALWVHTGCAMASVLDVVLPERHRSCGRLVVHGDRLSAQDVLLIGGVRVTAVARTAVDLARWEDPEQVRRWFPRLVEAGLTEVALAGAMERAARIAQVSRARRVLTELTAVGARPTPGPGRGEVVRSGVRSDPGR